MNPRKIKNVEMSSIVRGWRVQLQDNMGRERARKLLSRLSLSGVVLQIENGKVVDYVCLGKVEDETLLGMKGKDWLVLGGIENSSNRRLIEVWNTEASGPGEMDKQRLRGYSSQYRGKHRSEVKYTFKAIARAINNENRKPV